MKKIVFTILFATLFVTCDNVASDANHGGGSTDHF